MKELFILLVILFELLQWSCSPFLAVCSGLCLLWVWPWQHIFLGFGNPPTCIQLPWEKKKKKSWKFTDLSCFQRHLWPRKCIWKSLIISYLLKILTDWIGIFPKSEIKQEMGFLLWFLKINIKVYWEYRYKIWYIYFLFILKCINIPCLPFYV